MAISPRFAISIFCKACLVYHLRCRGLPSGFRLFAVGLFLILTFPRMTQPGMFSDGVVYASIARNMAEGRGSFWSPEYTKTVLTTFADHPPLGLGLEAVLFRIAGDHPYVERAYSLAAGSVLALLIVLLWRRAGPDPRGDWLPLIFWLLPSFVSWSIVNNMLDVTQAAFTTVAVLAAVAAMRTARHTTSGHERRGMWSALAGLTIAAAVLTKGPTGLFPLAVPAIYAATVDRRLWTRAAIATAAMLGVLAAASAALWSYPPAQEYAREYLRWQLLPSLSGQREAAESRWHFAAVFGSEIVARMGGLLLILWWAARRAVKPRPARSHDEWSSHGADLHGPRLALCFFCVGLSASLPIAISPKMMGHYLVPSIPMFAMACALFVWDGPLRRAFANHDGSRHTKYLAGAAGVLLIGAAFAIPFVRGPLEERDVPRLGALNLIGPALQPGEIVRTCPDAEGDWPLHAYLQRFLHVSMDAATPTPRQTFLRLLDRPCDVPAGCVLVRFAGDLELYACPAP